MANVTLISLVQSIISNNVSQTPSVPESWAKQVKLGKVPVQAEIDQAEGGALDLVSVEEYRETFGRNAPSQEEVVSSLLTAHFASEERRRAEDWVIYTKDMEARAWGQALPLVTRLRRFWLPAAEAEKKLAETFPRLAQLMGVRAGIGERAARARGKAVKAKAVKAAGGKVVPPTLLQRAAVLSGALRV